MRRRSAEPDAADPAPFAHDRGQGHPRRGFFLTVLRAADHETTIRQSRSMEENGGSGRLGCHLDGAAGAFGGAPAAAPAVVVVDLVLAVAELDDGVVRADAVAVVAAEAVAAGHAAARLEQRGGVVQAAGRLVEGT